MTSFGWTWHETCRPTLPWCRGAGAATVDMTTMMLWRRARRSSGRDRDETGRRSNGRHAVMVPVAAQARFRIRCCAHIQNSTARPGAGRAQTGHNNHHAGRVEWCLGGVADDFRLSCPGAPGRPNLDSEVGSGWLGQDEISEDPDRRCRDVMLQSTWSLRRTLTAAAMT